MANKDHISIYNIGNAIIKSKMAAFDFDWTLVNPKSGNTFPTDIDDWEFLYPSIPVKLATFYNNDYCIVIFTNQSKKWKHEQIKNVCKIINIPLFIVIANNKKIYKPNIELYNNLIKNNYIDKQQSFFVGDALGRKIDFSDCDKQFAINIGIKVLSPEDIFINKNETDVSLFYNSFINEISINNSFIIIMVGFPGSGKSSAAKVLCNKYNNILYVSGDTYKTSGKMIKFAESNIQKQTPILFDATNSSIKKRKEYIDFGKKHNYNSICIYLKTNLSNSFKRNRLRDSNKQVPKIAYSIYNKYFQYPNVNEGFTLYEI